MSEYKITKEQCESNISGVCSRCGGELSAIETVDNANNPTYWCGCVPCSCFDNGVLQIAFDIAKVLIYDDGETYYGHIDKGRTPEEVEHNNKAQMGGMTRLVQRILRLNSNP